MIFFGHLTIFLQKGLQHRLPSGQGKEGGAPGALRSPWLDGTPVTTDGGAGVEDLNGWHRALVHDARALMPG